MNYYEIRDRVPCSEIDALTAEAARVWLERKGLKRSPISHRRGDWYEGSGHTWSVLLVTEEGQPLTQTVEDAHKRFGIPPRAIIAEIRAIAEWQKRCKEWVAPKEGESCNRCWKCNDVLAMPWEAPATSFPFAPTCPTCGNKRCPRATDHRNECSGSNEPGQVGSWYA